MTSRAFALSQKGEKMLLYPAVFKTDGDYISVHFPDVPEAMTQGKDLDEAYKMAEEVLGFALEDYTEMPKASSIEEVKKVEPDATIALIAIDMVAYMRKYHSKVVRKNVSIPEYLAILAKEQGINVSQVLTEALEEKVNFG